MLYHSTFIGRAGPKHKGRISRFLANKCSIAARIDCYSGKLAHYHTPSNEPLTRISIENPTPKFGEALRSQVEQRLLFFEKGEPPTKNAEVIQKVLEELALERGVEEDGDVDMDEEPAEPALTTLEPSPPPKKEKKKKRKVDDMDVDGEVEEEEEPKAKKAKLSKEEKKALKKAKKEKEKAEAAEVSKCDLGVYLS